MNVKKVVKERDHAFTEAVMHDNWAPALAYVKKYAVPMPEDPTTLKWGIYKATQGALSIPEEVRTRARILDLETKVMMLENLKQ